MTQDRIDLRRSCRHLSFWPGPASVHHFCTSAFGVFMIRCPIFLAFVRHDASSLLGVIPLDGMTPCQCRGRVRHFFWKQRSNIYLAAERWAFRTVLLRCGGTGPPRSSQPSSKYSLRQLKEVRWGFLRQFFFGSEVPNTKSRTMVELYFLSNMMRNFVPADKASKDWEGAPTLVR